MTTASLLELGACLQDGPGCREALWVNVVVGWDAIVEVVRFFLAESKVR